MTDHLIMKTLDDWVTYMASEGFSPLTVRTRLQVVRQVSYFAGRIDPAELRVEHVRSFLASRPLATWSRLSYLQHLRAWAKYAGISDPTAGIRRPSTPRTLPDPLPEDALLQLLQHIKDENERCWVLLGAYAGLRAHEVAKLHPTDLTAEGLRVLGKGGRVDVIPVAPIITRALQGRLSSTAAFWPGVSPMVVSHSIKIRADELNLRFRFHRLRHRFGTQVYRHNRDLLLTQRLMRHASPRTTAGYAALCDDDAATTVYALPGALPEEVTEE